jgi:transcription antitermination factor NusG
MSEHKLSLRPAYYCQQSEIVSSTHVVTPEDPWYVLRVRRHADFTVSSHLESRGFTQVFPTRVVDRRWPDRKVTAQVPLFPGYIFCQFNISRIKILISTPGRSSVISFGANFASVNQQDIYFIKQLMKQRLSLRPTPILPRGQKVAVLEGPLKCLEGWFEETSPEIFLVRIHFFQQAVRVQLERLDLVPSSLLTVNERGSSGNFHVH